MDALAKVCRAQGLRLAYHNHNPEFANHNAEIEALAAATNPELVDFLMDAGHGYLGGGNPAEFMTRHSRRILGCHVKTFKGKQRAGSARAGRFRIRGAGGRHPQNRVERMADHRGRRRCEGRQHRRARARIGNTSGGFSECDPFRPADRREGLTKELERTPPGIARVTQLRGVQGLGTTSWNP